MFYKNMPLAHTPHSLNGIFVILAESSFITCSYNNDNIRKIYKHVDLKKNGQKNNTIKKRMM